MMSKWPMRARIVRPDFLSFIKVAFPAVDWERAYEEYRAAGEKEA